MDLNTVIEHLIAVKQYTTASYAFAIYEYLITFDREFDTFWRRKFSFATILWFLNRYTLYISLIPTLIGFHVPFPEKYPGAMEIVSNIASGLTLMLRVYALYGQARWVLVILVPVFIAEIGVEAWAVAGGVPAMLPPGQVGCILTGRPDQGDRFAAFWIGQLVFPTLIFLMTITRAIRMGTSISFKGSILMVMLRDGILYFIIIFLANLVNVITYSVAPVELKFANAPFTNVITTLMICRLMLNLRQAGTQDHTSSRVSTGNYRISIKTNPAYLGDLGEDLDIDSFNQREQKRAHESDMGYLVREESDFEMNSFSVR